MRIKLLVVLLILCQSAQAEMMRFGLESNSKHTIGVILDGRLLKIIPPHEAGEFMVDSAKLDGENGVGRFCFLEGERCDRKLCTQPSGTEFYPEDFEKGKPFQHKKVPVIFCDRSRGELMRIE